MSELEKKTYFSIEKQEIENIIIKLLKSYQASGIIFESSKILSLITKELKNFYNIDIKKFPSDEINKFKKYLEYFINLNEIDFQEQKIGLKTQKIIDVKSFFSEVKSEK